MLADLRKSRRRLADALSRAGRERFRMRPGGRLDDPHAVARRLRGDDVELILIPVEHKPGCQGCLLKVACAACGLALTANYHGFALILKLYL